MIVAHTTSLGRVIQTGKSGAHKVFSANVVPVREWRCAGQSKNVPVVNAATRPQIPDSPIFSGIKQPYADLDKMALRVIRPALESAGLQWRGWHAFRRGVASNLFQLGVDELTVQRILRHSKVNVTRERYIKVRDERVETAMAAFEDAIAKSKAVR